MFPLLPVSVKACITRARGNAYTKKALGNERDLIRGVAQLGSALDWGSRGRGFKSPHPD